MIIHKIFDEKVQEIAIQLAHLDENEQVFWYLDEEYITSTKGIHELSLPLQKVKYLLSVVDTIGNSLSQQLEVVTRD